MLTYLLIKTSRHMKNHLDRQLKVLNITASQFSVMQQIAILGNEAQAIQIAKNLESDKPTISGVINRLCKQGIILKTPHLQDRRASLLSLTDEGFSVLDQARSIADQVSGALLSDCSQKECELMEKVLKNILGKVAI